jgi:hypothetical protein
MAHPLLSTTVVEARCVDVDVVTGKVAEAEDALFSTMIVTCFDDGADLAMHGEIVHGTGYPTVYLTDYLTDYRIVYLIVYPTVYPIVYLNVYLTACLTGYLTGCLIVSEIEMRTETAHPSLPTVY